ncbi:MAG: hypothetical protein J7L15_09410 [Clostridiales bacterium]|nr:hypothetical protein [Clostridiales bacterium]
MDIIKSLDDVVNVLSGLGYSVTRQDQCVSVAVGNVSSPFPAIITIEDNSLSVTCEVAKKCNINKEVEIDFLWGMADINTDICPYALAVISEDVHEDRWPIVLIDSMPIGDLSEEELESSMDSLLFALLSIKDLFQAGLVVKAMSDTAIGG